MSNENKEELDVFKEAAQMASKSSISKTIVTTENIEQQLSIEEQALKLTEQLKNNQWDLLKQKINGPFAKRAIEEIDALSGREFLKAYFKLLEYVNPKVIRKEVVEGEDENTEIKVTIYQQNNTFESGVEKIIDVKNPDHEK
jgi:hypothetical protein